MAEIAHKHLDFILGDRGRRIVGTEEPCRVILQLRVAITQELEVPVAKTHTVLNHSVDIAKETLITVLHVETFVVVFIYKV